jgi:hypothetical protein
VSTGGRPGLALTYRYVRRDFRLTDISGVVVKEILS